MDISLSMDANQPVDADSTLSNEWETWGHEPIIDLCEVQVGFDGNYICELIPFAVEAQADSELALTSRKLAPIRHEYGAEISNLKFVCTPPSVSNGESSQSADHVAEKGQVSLLAAFLNFDNYSSAPQSHLSVYTVSRATEPSVLANSSWSGILTFIIPSAPNASGCRLYAGVYDVDGTVVSSALKSQDVTVGTTSVLRLWVYYDAPKDTTLPFALVASIYAFNATADITHTVLVENIPADAAADALDTALAVFNDNSLNKSGTRAWEIVGVAVEMYRYDIIVRSSFYGQRKGIDARKDGDRSKSMRDGSM
ncbi:hypothetical protein HWV62_25615 [Athelia sp. TMB]|nr:hypothetical protein HWV62_25615 [Athelia sp. TMB]